MGGQYLSRGPGDVEENLFPGHLECRLFKIRGNNDDTMNTWLSVCHVFGGFRPLRVYGENQNGYSTGF